MDIGLETLKQSLLVTLPIELIFSCILPKLPAKSLLRFKCVSKSFLTEISSHKFNASFSEANRFFIVPDKLNRLHIYELDSPNSPPTICPYPILAEKYAPLVARCESYLLIRCINTHDWSEALVLLNPITRFYRILPKLCIPDSCYFVSYGMYHCLDDEFNNDFKVVGFVECAAYGDNRMKVDIYHLRTNLWRTIECERTMGERMGYPVLVQNHLLVMIFCDDDNFLVTRIGCFDIKAERWSNDVLLPDTIQVARYYYLGVLDGKLSFLWYDVNKATCTTWVMRDYGVKSSWFKLMSLPAQGTEEIYHPIAYRKGSSHELLCISEYTGKCYWYSLIEKQFTEAEFDGNGLDTNYLPFTQICKGSLSNFRGGQPIRGSSKEQDVDDDDEMLMLDWS